MVIQLVNEFCGKLCLVLGSRNSGYFGKNGLKAGSAPCHGLGWELVTHKNKKGFTINKVSIV